LFKDRELTIALKIILMLLLIVSSIWFVISIQWVIKLFVFSLLIVYLIAPAVSYLEDDYHFAHLFAVAIVFLGFFLFCLLIISLLFPVISEQYQELAANFPHHLNRIQEYIEHIAQTFIHLNLGRIFNEVLAALPDTLGRVFDQLAEFSLTLVLGLIDLFFILFIVFYLLYDFTGVKKGPLRIVPARYRSHVQRFISIFDVSIGGFIRGLLLRGLVVGILTWIALLIVGMPYALLLAIIAGIFNIILYIGPYIAAVPAVLLSFSPAAPSPLLIIILYIGIQVFDGLVLAPLFFGRTVNLKPITVIIAILIGSQLAGLLGMIIAVPIAGALKKIMEIIQDEHPLKPTN
jgi:predicted PurR-regulated permease PerM